MTTYTAEQLQEILRKHTSWRRNEEGGERADLSWADLSGAYLSWNSGALLSEILYRASGTDLGCQALAALIARRTDWCWQTWTSDKAPKGIEQEEWKSVIVAHRDWALSELAKWVKDGDDAPGALRQYVAKEQPA